MNARDKLRVAFDHIYDNYPFLSWIVCKWKVVETDKVPTAATNGPQLFYNPSFIDTLDQGETCWLIKHEAAHIFLGHHFRREEGMDQKLWNIACDLALNQYIGIDTTRDGVIKKSALLPGMPDTIFQYMEKNRNAEYYYDQLAKDAKTFVMSSAIDDLPQSPGDILDHPDLQDASSEEREAIVEQLEQEWQESIGRAASQSKTYSTLPGWAKEVVDQAMPPAVIDWRRHLSRLMTQVTNTSITYMRPNRRMHHLNPVIMPSRHNRMSGRGALIVDTSGSMDQASCNAGIAELEKILALFPECEVDMFQCDTRMIEEATRTFTRADFPLRVPMEWWGRGGTNLTPAFEFVRQSAGKYQWVACLTDMEWMVSECVDPGVPTFWLSTERSEAQLSDYYKPQFGVVLGPIKPEVAI